MAMTYEQVIEAARAKGYGSADFINGGVSLESATVEENINGDGGLSLSWKSSTGGVIRAGSTLLGYIMMNNYVPSLGSDGIYTWTPKFSEPAALLGKTPYFKTLTTQLPSGGGTEKSSFYSFSFAGAVSTILNDVRTFLSANVSTTWSLVLNDPDGVIASQRIVVSFDGDNVKTALQKIADAAGVNLYYVGYEIRMGKSNAYADSEYYNRFIVLGGTKNMAKRTPTGNGYAAVTQRLSLDPSLDYVEEGSIIDLRSPGEAAMTKLLVFDDIYPKLSLTIRTAVPRLCYLLDNEGNKIPDGQGDYKKYCKWYVTFDLDGAEYVIAPEYMIFDKPLGILFQSGPLAGREFQLAALPQGTHEEDEDDVYIGGHTVTHTVEYRIVCEASGDLILPTMPAGYDNGGLCPQTGDWITPVNVAIEDSIKEAARRKLYDEGLAMARIIHSDKQPSYTEERTGADFITGEAGTVPSIGDEVGGSDGYVVTSVRYNLISGVCSVSYGTFKPKGLLSSTIDKVESVSVSGGEGTVREDVDTKGTTYIYLPGSNEDSNGLKDLEQKAINEAGGNIGKKITYRAVGSEVFAELIQLIYENDKATMNTEAASFAINLTPTSGGRWWYHGGTLKKNGTTIDDAVLSAAFSAVLRVAGERVITVCYNSFTGTPNDYDMIVHVVKFVNPLIASDVTYGGITAQLYEDGTWRRILETSTGIVDNLGKMIKMVVFGSNDGTTESAGILTTQNFVQLFARQVDDGTGRTLAEAVFGMGIETRHYAADGKEVFLGEDNKWYYGNGTPYNGVVTDRPNSFARMKADNIDFTSDNFKIEATKIANIKAGQIVMDGETITLTSTTTLNMKAGIINLDASKVNFMINGKNSLKEAGFLMTADLMEQFIADIDATAFDSTDKENIQKRLGMVVRKDDSGSTFHFGTYSYNSTTQQYTFNQGLTFIKGNDLKTRLRLTADDANIDANSITFTANDLAFLGNNITFAGKDFSDAVDSKLDSFTVLAKHIGFSASDLNITADDISFSATNSFKAAVGDAGFLLSSDLISALITDLSSVSSSDKKSIQNKLGIVVSSTSGSGTNSVITLGTYDASGNFIEGIKFYRDATTSKLLLKSDNISFDANNVIDNTSSTIDFSAKNVKFNAANVTFGSSSFNNTVDGRADSRISTYMQTFTVSSQMITFDAADLVANTTSTIDFSSKNIKLKASQITFEGETVGISALKTLTFNSGGTIDFRAIYVKIDPNDLEVNADKINFSGKTIDMSAATSINLNASSISLNAGKLSWSGQSIDLTASTLSVNASQITWKGQTVIEGGKFTVDSNGDVSMNNLSANNATITGKFQTRNGLIQIFNGQSFENGWATSDSRFLMKVSENGSNAFSVYNYNDALYKRTELNLFDLIVINSGFSGQSQTPICSIVLRNNTVDYEATSLLYIRDDEVQILRYDEYGTLTHNTKLSYDGLHIGNDDGQTGSFVSLDGKTVTTVGGIVTGITSGASVSISTNMLPYTNRGYDLGSTSYRWENIHAYTVNSSILYAGIMKLEVNSGGGASINAGTAIGLGISCTNVGLTATSGSISLNASTSITANKSIDTSSDMRRKNVRDAVEADLEDIARTPVFNFEYKDSDGRLRVGTSAQYIQSVFPNAVTKMEDGYLAMDYGSVALASAILTARTVLTHKEEIAALKKEVKELKDIIHKLNSSNYGYIDN